MTVYPIDITMELPAQALIDIFIIQWHTPLPVQGANWSKIPNDLAREKGHLLDNFRGWLINYFQPNFPQRPLFILTPELSMPTCHIDLFDGIVSGLNRPVVVIAGLEYLQWDEYRGLANALSHPPPLEAWFHGGLTTHIVNAAGIWIRDSNGYIWKYFQPKRNPQDQEQAIPVYPGRHLLLFRSRTQTDGARLNFCVQVCSDFSSSEHVRTFRQEIARICPGLSLDLTFLLQCNRDQEAIQFKQAVQEYFSVPNRKVPTDHGCLLFINNANHGPGKSPDWGRSKLHFPYERWRYLRFAPSTYRINNDGAHNHQAVVLRESGPAIYWLVYKPHYLVPRIPGSGQALPFPETGALYVPIKGDVFTQGVAANCFISIPAVCHWLHEEWLEGKADLESSMTENHIHKEVSTGYLDSYQLGLEEWSRVLDQQDYLARNALDIYFECWKQDCYPHKEAEPQKWDPNASTAVKRMMRTYALLQLGADSFPNGTLKPDPQGVRHVSVDDELRITFMWGGGERFPRNMVTTYLAAREDRGQIDLLSPKCLLIMINPDGNTGKTELLNFVEAGGQKITQGISDVGMGEHLRELGDVVVVKQTERLRLLYDSELSGEIGVAANGIDLKGRLTAIIQGELA